MTLSRLLTQSALLLCGALLLAGGAFAQAQRTLVIRGGQVVLDGKPLPAAELPPSLTVDGVEASFAFSGPARPLLELNGHYYVLEPGRVVEVKGLAGTAPSLFFFAKEAPKGSAYHVLEQQARELEQQADVLRRTRVEATLAPSLDALARKAEQTAQVAVQLPALEWQQYMADVQSKNRDLYASFVREWQVEAATFQLADRLRHLEAGHPQRAALLDSLNLLLDESFELKQENRRREISQFEARLGELRERLLERERLRARIIEARREQLLQPNQERDW